MRWLFLLASAWSVDPFSVPVTVYVNAAFGNEADGWTAWDEAYPMQQAVKLFNTGRLLPGLEAPAIDVNVVYANNLGEVGTGLKNTATGFLLWDPAPNIMIGCSWSSVSMASSALMGSINQVHLGYSSTNALLSNKAVYPYFLRVIPPDSLQSRALADMAAHYKYTKLTAIYTDDGYSKGLHDDFFKFANEMGISVTSFALRMGHAETEWAGVFEQAAAAGSRIYFGMCSMGFVPHWWSNAIDHGIARNVEEPNLVIGAESFLKLADNWYGSITQESDMTGLMGVAPVSKGPLWQGFEEFCTEDYNAGKDSWPEFFHHLFEDRTDLAEKHGLPVNGGSCSPAFYAPFAADAMFTALKAMDALAKRGTPAQEIRGELLRDEIMASDYEGVTGNLKLDESGDRLADFEVWNFQGTGGLPPVMGMWSATGGVNMAGDIVIMDGTTDLVPQGFPECLPGTTGFRLGMCTECPAGSKGPGGMTSCVECGPGTFAEEPGSSDCFECRPGTFSNAPGSSQCEVCPDGQFAEEGAQTFCTNCPAGTYRSASMSATSCEPCEVGTYHDPLEMGTAAAACKACPATFTTMTMGATLETWCTCPPGTYWNRKDDVCVACPAEGFCPGGLHLPVVYEGNYGVYLGSVENHEAEEQDKLDPLKNYTAQSGSFYKMEVYKCSGKTRCPGETLPFSMREYSIDSVSTDFVRVGYPLDGACPVTEDPRRQREGIACDRCQDGYYGAGVECAQCEGGATAGSLILILIMPFVMMCIYRGTTSSGTQRVQAAFILVSTCGMAAFFMQTIAVLDTFAFSWPEELAWLFELSRIFMFDLQGLSLSCFHGESFAGKYWTTILVPLFIIFVTGIGFGITKVLPVPEEWKMQVNQTFSMLGMLLSALYITLVKVVVAYFECPENPAAEPTLAKYKDVVCGSDEHKGAMPAMLLGLVLYVLGFYLKFVHSAYIAPSMWMNVAFREMWKFMLTRWRPDVWYWGCVVMTRNLLVAFAGVISSEPRVQLVYVVCVVTITFSVTAVNQPWRAPVLNHYDVLSSIVLCFIGIFGLIFVSLQAEVALQQRFGLSVQQKEDEQKVFASGLTVLISIFMALFGALCVWCLNMLVPSSVAKFEKQHTETCNALIEKLNATVANEDFCKEAARLIRESTAYDRAGLENFIQKVFADQASHTSGATDTISFNKAKAKTTPTHVGATVEA